MTHHAPEATVTRRITRLLAACACALALLAVAAPTAMASPATRASAVGWIRLAHLSPNAPAVDVYLYSEGDTSAMIVLHHVSYGTVSPYETVHPGGYTVAMRAAGAAATSAPVLSTTVHILAGHAYTVAGMGPAKGLRLQVLEDTLTTPSGQGLVRVIQASLKDQRVTVTAGSKTLARNLSFGSFTSYVPLAPGTVNLHAAGGSMSASSSLTVAADTTHTIVVLDDPGHLSLDILTDAAGSNALPAGGVKTGFGGMAARPGSSALPWVAAMASGALLAAAGALWLCFTGRKDTLRRFTGRKDTLRRGNRQPVIRGSHAR